MADEGDEKGEAGAVVLQPKPPPGGTFSLLIPADMCWEARDFGGGAVRLDFRPRTLAEKAARYRDGGR
jgi:hypothetical protein